MIHSVPELKVTQKLAQKLGKADTVRLLEEEKLVLLVDLDQTLIHTTNDNIPNNLKGVYHFQLYGPHSPWYHTRLRPGTFTFLSNMAPFFELHICTFGARNYAHMIAQFLDEDGKYFSHRILSRDECFNVTSKTDNLRALFPCGDSMVCIIDDREDVWNMASNLIQVKPYHFFQHTGDINAPPGMDKHELDGKGVDFTGTIHKDWCSLKVIKIHSRILDISSSSQKDQRSPDEIDDKTETEIDNTPKVDVSETDAEKCITEDEKEESAQTPSDIPRIPTPEDTSTVAKIETSDTKTKTPHIDEPSKSSSSDCDDLIEVEDSDDYLLHLESILKTIHTRFYTYYKEHGKVKIMFVWWGKHLY